MLAQKIRTISSSCSNTFTNVFKTLFCPTLFTVQPNTPRYHLTHLFFPQHHKYGWFLDVKIDTSSGLNILVLCLVQPDNSVHHMGEVIMTYDESSHHTPGIFVSSFLMHISLPAFPLYMPSMHDRHNVTRETTKTTVFTPYLPLVRG